MCPGIFCPGQTLDLSLPEPMHPGLLWDLVTPRTSWPMPLKPHRFITPWKPRRTLVVRKRKFLSTDLTNSLAI